MKYDNIYILGGYQTDFARNWAKENKHISAMMREAYEGSLASTEINPKDIDATFIGNFAAEIFCMQGHLGSFFIDFDPCFRGLPTYRVEAACASGGLAILTAMAHIRAGLYDVICIIGVEQMKTVSPRKCADFLGTATWYERESANIEFPFPKLFGKLGDEYDRRFGLKDEYLAHIANINYANARLNPNAQTRRWYMSYDHARCKSEYNPSISGRIKVTDCSQITDGAVCMYMASETYAEEYAKRHDLLLAELPKILGWGHTTAPIEFSTKIHESAGQSYVLPWTRKAILDAYGRANIQSCWQLDVIETHDCFTTSEYMSIDHFGITKPGESWKALEDGVIEITGRLPINPSGGLIGCGHPVGATGVRQLLDAYKQITEKAGGYQVPNARRVAVLNIGGSATTNICFILGI